VCNSYQALWYAAAAAAAAAALQADDEAVLLRLGLAVMGALQLGLLELDDFEALITHLKVGQEGVNCCCCPWWWWCWCCCCSASTGASCNLCNSLATAHSANGSVWSVVGWLPAVGYGSSLFAAAAAATASVPSDHNHSQHLHGVASNGGFPCPAFPCKPHCKFWQLVGISSTCMLMHQWLAYRAASNVLLQVKPLSWPMHMHRKVLNEALHSPASNAELAAATAAVQAEFARLGRFSSFSSHQLAAQPLQQQQEAAIDEAGDGSSSSSSGGSGVRLALVPGTMGPRTQASAAALEALEAAAAANAGSSSSSSKTSDTQQHNQQAQQQQEVKQQQQHDDAAEGSDRSVSGVLCEMDAALLGLMQDMDIMMPAEPAAVDKQR
jgi:hypothetical protein